MQSTRQRIMDYLEENHSATAPELSRFFAMTVANLRHHLNALGEMGMVEVVGQVEPEGRGRPALIYMPTRTAQEHNLDTLASALLGEILASLEGQVDRIKNLAKRLEDGRGVTTGAITRRLLAVVHRLNNLHYKAHWEAHADAPRIILGRCPYAAIIADHPELCQMDAFLIEELAGIPANQLEKLTHSPDGPFRCVFALR
ncbi:MAG: helix-turn-helix domain-containing protein [Anaerolineales bacterium]|nr:helix-turn-helix domain-containing protein [Anaerolineales bacterium]